MLKPGPVLSWYSEDPGDQFDRYLCGEVPDGVAPAPFDRAALTRSELSLILQL